MRWPALALAALALGGCESSQEKSAKLEKGAKAREAQAVRHRAAEARELTISRPSTKLAVTEAVLLEGTEAQAVVVTLHNHSSQTILQAPVKVTVRDGAGQVLYTNETQGQSHSLLQAAAIPAHASLHWIDDQVQAQGHGLTVQAEVGEGTVATSALPLLKIGHAHVSEDPTNGPGAEGMVLNESSVVQEELAVDATASRAGKVVAAGRAVLSSVPAHGSTRFQLFFVGSPAGARLEVDAPPTSVG